MEGKGRSEGVRAGNGTASFWLGKVRVGALMEAMREKRLRRVKGMDMRVRVCACLKEIRRNMLLCSC